MTLNYCLALLLARKKLPSAILLLVQPTIPHLLAYIYTLDIIGAKLI